jgi:hypothetical protein
MEERKAETAFSDRATPGIFSEAKDVWYCSCRSRFLTFPYAALSSAIT